MTIAVVQPFDLFKISSTQLRVFGRTNSVYGEFSDEFKSSFDFFDLFNCKKISQARQKPIISI